MERTILKVLVGSRAHGLATPESDFDYRGVFLVPTDNILSLGSTKKNVNWIEGKVDDTSWELGHFLYLATKSNPTILETFISPIEGVTIEGEKLRRLFDYVWSSKGVRDAFTGYGINQRKKFLAEKDKKPDKFAAAYARSLYNAYELLTTGTFTIKISETEVGKDIRRFKDGDYTFGEVIDYCRDLESKVNKAFEDNPDKETNMEPINEFLLDIRKNNFN